jgi:hypothetical protein
MALEPYLAQFILHYCKTREDVDLAVNLHTFYDSYRLGLLEGDHMQMPKLRSVPYNPIIYWDVAEAIACCDESLRKHQCVSCQHTSEIAERFVLERILEAPAHNREETAEQFKGIVKGLKEGPLANWISLESPVCSPEYSKPCRNNLPHYRVQNGIESKIIAQANEREQLVKIAMNSSFPYTVQ